MSTFEKLIEVGDFEGKRFETLRAIVDTGATYTLIPRDVLEQLQVSPTEERPFILANGEQVIYGMAWVRVRLEGREQPTQAIFGRPGSDPFLGAVTLEEFGLSVDPLNQRLVPTPGYLVGIREVERPE
jgi:clan AA aspartic protease